MLDIVGRPVRLCDGISRRGFLRVGSLGAGLTLPSVLKARQAQAATADRNDTAIILLFQAGGASHIDMYDMKPAMSAEVRGPFNPIATNQPGLDVCELMPGHARIAEKLAVIRSINRLAAAECSASRAAESVARFGDLRLGWCAKKRDAGLRRDP